MGAKGGQLAEVAECSRKLDRFSLSGTFLWRVPPAGRLPPLRCGLVDSPARKEDIFSTFSSPSDAVLNEDLHHRRVGEGIILSAVIRFRTVKDRPTFDPWRTRSAPAPVLRGRLLRPRGRPSSCIGIRRVGNAARRSVSRALGALERTVADARTPQQKVKCDAVKPICTPCQKSAAV